MARFIRTQNMVQEPEGPRAFNVEDVLKKLATMEEHARRRAADALRAAREESEVIREQARKEGYATGHAEGVKQGLVEGKASGERSAADHVQKNIGPLREALQVMLAALERERVEIRGRAANDSLELAFQIAEVVAQVTLARDHVAVQRNVERAVDLLLDKSRLEISVNPACLEWIEQYIPELRERFDQIRDLALIGDPELTPGGCRVEAADGAVDATLETQMAELRKQLLEG